MDRPAIGRLLLEVCSAHVRAGSGWWVRRTRSLERVVTSPVDETGWDWDEPGIVDDERVASARELLAVRTPLLRFDWWRQGAEGAVVATEQLWMVDPGGGTAFLTTTGGDDPVASWALLSAVHPADSSRAWSAAVRDFMGAGCGRYYDCPRFDHLPSSTFNSRPDLVPRAEVARGFARAAGAFNGWMDLQEMYGMAGPRLHPELAPIPRETWPPDTFVERRARADALTKPQKQQLLAEYLRQTYRQR